MNPKAALFFIFSFVCFGKIHAQTIEQRVYASAGYVSQQVDYTIGEPLTSTYTTTGVVVNQGFHQPETFSIMLNELSESGSTDLFPNPAQDHFSVSGLSSGKEFELTIVDMKGIVLYQQLLKTETDVTISFLDPGAYVVFIKEKSGEIHSHHKIVKL